MFVSNVDELREIRTDLKAALGKLEVLIESADPATTTTENEALVEGPRTEAIEWVLRNRGGAPMRPVEIWTELQRLGRDDTKNVVQVATNDLYHRGRIGRSDWGEYHSL